MVSPNMYYFVDLMVWLDYADFILISVYMHAQTYAVHASVLISVYWYWNQFNEVNQRSHTINGWYTGVLTSASTFHAQKILSVVLSWKPHLFLEMDENRWKPMLWAQTSWVWASFLQFVTLKAARPQRNWPLNSERTWWNNFWTGRDKKFKLS